MQREMDVLSRQAKLLQKRFGKDVVDAARKDAERLRDQDELSYLGGPIRIKTNYAPKEEKLRDIKVTCACTRLRWPRRYMRRSLTRYTNPEYRGKMGRGRAVRQSRRGAARDACADSRGLGIGRAQKPQPRRAPAPTQLPRR